MRTRALLPPAWMDRAVCVQVDPEVFHPRKGEPVEPAKEICRSCDVRLECLDYALRRFDSGIFGGFSAEGREAVRRRIRDGRSLEDIIADDDAAYYERLDIAAQRAEATAARRREQARARAAKARQSLAETNPQPAEQAAA